MAFRFASLLFLFECSHAFVLQCRITSRSQIGILPHVQTRKLVPVGHALLRSEGSLLRARISLYGDNGEPGFNVVWDGHDAFVTERFQCSSKTLAQHVKSMMANGEAGRARELLILFGEEPAPSTSDTDIALRLLRLTFLSSGLRRILEGEILGLDVKEEEVEFSGLEDDDSMLEGMRSEVTRKTARNPSARSTPKLRQLDDDPYDEQELASMTVAGLKVLLGEAGLKKSGRKAELISRLKEAGW